MENFRKKNDQAQTQQNEKMTLETKINEKHQRVEQRQKEISEQKVRLRGEYAEREGNGNLIVLFVSEAEAGLQYGM